MFKFLSLVIKKVRHSGRSEAETRNPESVVEPLDSDEKLHFVLGLPPE
jgi:hypothetical protein